MQVVVLSCELGGGDLRGLNSNPDEVSMTPMKDQATSQL